MRTCIKCGSSLDDDVLYCTNCGTAQKQSSESQQTSNSNASHNSSQPTSSKSLVNPKITIGIIAILAVVAVAGIVFSGLEDHSPNPNNTPLWEAGKDTYFDYYLSGSYNNIYDPTSPHNVSGSMKTTIVSCTSTTLTAKSTGKITIDGLGTDPINSSGTSNRSDYKVTSLSKTTVSTKYGQKECYIIKQKTSSSTYNDITVTTYRGVDDGVMYRQILDQKMTSYGSTLMSCYITYTLNSYKITEQ